MTHFLNEYKGLLTILTALIVDAIIIANKEPVRHIKQILSLSLSSLLLRMSYALLQGPRLPFTQTPAQTFLPTQVPVGSFYFYLRLSSPLISI